MSIRQSGIPAQIKANRHSSGARLTSGHSPSSHWPGSSTDPGTAEFNTLYTPKKKHHRSHASAETSVDLFQAFKDDSQNSEFKKCLDQEVAYLSVRLLAQHERELRRKESIVSRLEKELSVLRKSPPKAEDSPSESEPAKSGVSSIAESPRCWQSASAVQAGGLTRSGPSTSGMSSSASAEPGPPTAVEQPLGLHLPFGTTASEMHSPPEPPPGMYSVSEMSHQSNATELVSESTYYSSNARDDAATTEQPPAPVAAAPKAKGRARPQIIICSNEQRKLSHSDSTTSEGKEDTRHSVASLQSEIIIPVRKVDEASAQDALFALWPIWSKEVRRATIIARNTISRRTGRGRANSFHNDGPMVIEDSDSESDSDTDSSMSDEDEKNKLSLALRCKRCCKALRKCDTRPLIVPPNHKYRVLWDIFAMFFVAYDSIVIPIQFLDLPYSPGLNGMAWVARIFWTMDMPLSCFTGYVLPDSRNEVRQREIIKRYLKTWFSIDILMLLVDWAEVVFGGVSGVNAARVGKNIKSLRLMRMGRLLRLLRLKRVPDFAKSLTYFLKNESTMMICSIIKMIIFLIWVNHTIACIWFAIGNDGPSEKNWLHQAQMEDRSREYQYFTAFHWSLTQFIGSMEITPSNVQERVYNITVLLLAFMVSASVISNITSSMTRLQIATAHHSEQMLVLTQYLWEKKISSKLAHRVQRNVKYALKLQKECLPEHSIELLEILSDPLRIELHFEMHMPVLDNHVFFKHYAALFENILKRVCHSAIAHLQLMRGDLLFCEEEVSPHLQMYFFNTGLLTYQHRTGFPTYIKKGQWACEATLWTPWSHCGTTRAKTECGILVLDGEKFQDILTQAPDKDLLAFRYGKNYVRALNDQNPGDLTDIHTDFIDLEELVRASADEARVERLKAEEEGQEDSSCILEAHNQSVSDASIGSNVPLSPRPVTASPVVKGLKTRMGMFGAFMAPQSSRNSRMSGVGSSRTSVVPASPSSQPGISRNTSAVSGDGDEGNARQSFAANRGLRQSKTMDF